MNGLTLRGWAGEDGQSTVEYGLIMVLVVTALIIGYATGLPTAVAGWLASIAGLLEGAL